MNKFLSLSLLVLLSFSAEANWQLSNEQSSVNFISIKKSTVGEVHRFTSLTGSLVKGKANVVIDLSSIDTKIPIRDERMKVMLFEVPQFSKATIDAAIDNSKLESLQDGEYYQTNITLSLSLHGVKKQMSSAVQVVKISNNSILVSSIHPVIIKALDFNLVNGIETLREIAKLPTISTAVPVTFNLLFKKFNQ